MQNYHIEQLYQGKLEARGVQTQLTRSNGQVLIPSHYFLRPKIDWERNSVNNYGDRFEGVEVRCRPTFEAANIERTPKSTAVLGGQSTPKLKPGRHSKEVEIDKVILDLERRGLDFNAMRRKDAYERIREHAPENFGANTGIGYSDTVLQARLNRRYGPRR
jgi:hypothetical protein